MALLISVSGVRGTTGGRNGDNLTPVDAVAFAAAYGTLLRDAPQRRIVIGRDARISGPMFSALVSQSLVGMGFEVIDIGLTTTPTLSMYIPKVKAAGGIVLTASHNPMEWNALKCLDEDGAFIGLETGKQLKALYEAGQFDFAPADALGSIVSDDRALDYHIEQILKLPFVDRDAIAQRNFRVALDAINSSGSVAIPRLLERLGVSEVKVLFGEPDGRFAHNPEPLPEHLGDLCQLVKKKKYDLGIAVDPDVDRLALIDEKGLPFGEENTLVAVADYWLSRNAGPVVSNLSSSRALQVVAEDYGQERFTSAVGEVHVVARMKEVGADLGGEGNGGIIVGPLHFGRDALVGLALFLSHVARGSLTVSEIKAELPQFSMVKQRMDLKEPFDASAWTKRLQKAFPDGQFDLTDGIKVDLPDGWLHLRPSNTEPIIRLYAEAATIELAESLCQRVMDGE